LLVQGVLENRLSRLTQGRLVILYLAQGTQQETPEDGQAPRMLVEPMLAMAVETAVYPE
tara:strand:+ start:365 stop:541 length:177 start_codon:yes stop_codon:yes gene_type:complete